MLFASSQEFYCTFPLGLFNTFVLVINTYLMLRILDSGRSGRCEHPEGKIFRFVRPVAPRNF